MADTVKELLGKFTVDTSSWSSAIASVKGLLAQLNSEEQARAAQNKAAQQASIAAVQSELAMRKQLSDQAQAAVSGETAKAAAVKATQSASAEAAKQQLAATTLQIAAEKQRAAALQLALLQQRNAAAEAIAFEKAYAAQLKEVAKNKAVAAALYDAAYQAQVAEVRAKRQLPTQKPLSNNQIGQESLNDTRSTRTEPNEQKQTQQTSQIPIVTTQEERVPLAETEVASYKAQSDAAVAASEETASAVAATSSAVTDANAKEIASNTAASDSAKAKATTIVSGAEKIVASEEAETLVTSKAAASYLELTAANERLAEARAAVAEVQQAVIKGTMSEATASQYLTSDLVVLRKAELDAAAAAKLYHEAQNGPSEHGHGSDGISQARKTKDSIDAIMGKTTIGPIDVLASKVPGLSTLISNAFPLIGISLFVGMLSEGITRFNEARKAAKEFGDTMRDAFSGFTSTQQEANDHLQLTNDQLAASIAKMEHKPVNNLALAIDEARIKADDLAKSAMSAYTEVKKLLEENQQGLLTRIFTGQDSSKDVDFGINAQMKNIKDTARDYAEAMKTGDPTKIATALQSYNSAKVNAGAFAQKNISDITRPQTRQKQIGQDQYGMPIYGGSETVQFDPNGPQKTNLEHYQLLQQYVGERNTNDQETIDQGNLQGKQKQDEEQQRQNEIAIKDAQAILDEKKRVNQAALENAIAANAKLEESNQQLYKSGIEDATAYYTTKKTLAQSAYDAEVKNINANRQAQLEQLNIDKRSTPGMTSVQYNAKRTGINASARDQLSRAGDTLGKAQSEDDIALQEQLNEAAKKQIQEQLDLKVKALQAETAATQQAFNQQTVSADDYLAKSLDLIDQQLVATVSAQEQIRSINGQNSAANIETIKAEGLAIADAQDKINKLNEASLSIRTQSSTKDYSSQNSLLSTQLGLAQNTNNVGGNSTTDQLGIIEQQMQLTSAYADQQAKLFNDPSLQQYSTTWFTIYENILKAKTSMLDMNVTMQELSSHNAQLGNTVSAGTSSLSSLFTSHFARGMESAVGAGGSAAANANKNLSGLTTGNWIATNPTYSSSSGSTGGRLDVSGTIDNFTKKLGSAVTAIGSFVSSIANAGSATAGAFGGGISGAGLGNSLGNTASSVSSAASAAGNSNGLTSLMGSAGPYGALIGAGIGAALGGIMGQKQEQVQTDITNLTNSFKTMMDSYSSNNSSLAQTVANLQSLIAQAAADQASTKKGGSQFADLITQYNQQITQLEAQQAQIMAQMSQQLIQISSPQAYQPLISSIQSIIQQYTSFVGAAQNATQLAQANDYLTTSLQNLATSYSQTLQQDQITAIQEALQLNQLYNQRNQLEYQYLQQVQSIQGQGTITRGVTLAQSKYSQLYNLDVNTANQLNSINQQIDLTQAQVTAAQQVFQLATTQAGLQTQLLGLQEQGIALDMSRIVAMQNTLQLLQQTGYSIVGNLASMNTSDPNALMTLILQILAQELGINTGGSNSAPSGTAGTTSSSLLTSLSATAYAVQGSYGYAGFTGTNL